MPHYLYKIELKDEKFLEGQTTAKTEILARVALSKQHKIVDWVYMREKPVQPKAAAKQAKPPKLAKPISKAPPPSKPIHTKPATSMGCVACIAKPISDGLVRQIESALIGEVETGLVSDLWGKIGELFAEEQFGIRCHPTANAQGSDGRLGNDFVEVKTISPTKHKARIHVKRAGNFSQLAIVRVHPDYHLEAILVSRAVLKKGSKGIATLSWSTVVEHGNKWVVSPAISVS